MVRLTAEEMGLATWPTRASLACDSDGLVYCLGRHLVLQVFMRCISQAEFLEHDSVRLCLDEAKRYSASVTYSHWSRSASNS